MHARVRELEAAETTAWAFSLLYRVSFRPHTADAPIFNVRAHGETPLAPRSRLQITAVESEQDESAAFAAAVAKRRIAYRKHLDGVPSVVRPGWHVKLVQPASLSVAAAPTPAPPVTTSAAPAPVAAPPAEDTPRPLLRVVTHRRTRPQLFPGLARQSPSSPPKTLGSPQKPAMLGATADGASQTTQTATQDALLSMDKDPFPVVMASDTRDEALRRAQNVAKAMKFSNDVVCQKVLCACPKAGRLRRVLTIAAS